MKITLWPFFASGTLSKIVDFRAIRATFRFVRSAESDYSTPRSVFDRRIAPKTPAKPRFLRFSRSIDFKPRADNFLEDRVAFSRRSQHPSTFDRRSRPLFGKSSFFSKTKRPAHLPIFRRPLGLIFSRLLRSFRCKDRFENFSAILHSDLAFRLAYGSQPLSPSPLFSARRLRRLFAPFCSNFSLGQRSHRCWLRFTPEHCCYTFFSCAQQDISKRFARAALHSLPT